MISNTRLTQKKQGTKIALLILVILFVFSLFSKFLTIPTSSALITQEQISAINSGDSFVQISLLILLVLILLINKSINMYSPLSRNLLLLTYTIFLTISLFYSQDRDLTLRRLILFYVIMSFGLFLLLLDNDIEYLFKIIYKFTIIYLAITLIGIIRNIFVFGLPLWHVPFSNFGASHRDGEIFAIGLIVAIGTFIIEGKKEKKIRTTILLLFIFLILTGSRTSLIGFIVSILYLIWQFGSKKNLKRFAIILSLIVLIIAAFYLLPSQSKENIIREDSVNTLTGRIPLWDTLLFGINQNVFFGSGFGAFWNLEKRDTIQFLVGWAAPGAHNGFLEVFLNTGLIGIFFIISILISIWYKSKSLQIDKGIIVRSLLLFIIAQNITQGSFQYLRNYVEVIFMWIMIFILLRKMNLPPNCRQEEKHLYLEKI